MKIIAKVTEGRFIVEATGDELARIMGFNSSYSLKDESRLQVGRDVQVNKLYDALTVERARTDEIKNQAAALRKTADRLDSINAALDCPIVEAAS